MKKFLRTGKKALSVFMAVMMVLTAWVFFEPTKASAAAGSYYVLINWTLTNDSNAAGAVYKGKGSITVGDSDGSFMGISIFYKTNNGTGSTGEVYWDIGTKDKPCGEASGSGATVTNSTGYMDDKKGSSFQCAAIIPGFPTELFATCNYDSPFTKAEYRIDSIKVGKSSSSTLTTLWSGDEVKLASHLNQDYVTINASGLEGVYSGSIKTNNWSTSYPYASSITVTADKSSVTCPKTASDSAATVKVTASATDQYGVTMFDPTWTVSSNISDAQGFSVSPKTSAASTTASVTYLANQAGTTDSQTLTVTATWSTPSNSTYSSRSKTATITVNDASYTAKFTGLKDSNGDTIADEETTGIKYGHTPNAATTASSYSIGDYDYFFSGWSPTLEPPLDQITADTTYTAQYSSTFEAADLTELKAQINAANAVISSKEWADGGYTTDSMNTVLNALDTANSLNKDTTGRTQQGAVNTAASNLKAAISALSLNTYSVIFYDASGAMIKIQDVTYGNDATAPENNPVKNDDEAFHYTWNGWNKAYTNVKSNLEIHPTYNAVEHSWGTATTTAANCQHGSGTTKTCTVCGRVSYSYDDTLGDHNKSTKYVIDSEPSCTATGSGHYYCTICNANLETVTIPAKGHSYKETAKTDSTCAQTGTRTFTCSACGDVKTETIPLKQHNYVKNSTVAATCQHSGYDVMKCSVCGDTYNKYLGNATNNHSWNITSAPSATHGYDTVTGSCSVCGASFTKEVAEGHSFTEYEVTSMPTCSTVGTLTIKCSDASCTASYQVDIPATGVHNIETVYTAPSCTATGSIVNNCKDCSYSQTVETIEKLTHSYDYVRTEPTCTTAGSLVQTCSLCGNKKTTVLPATGHKAVTLPAVAATCNTKGKTEGSECGVCHAVLVAQTETAKTAHSFTGAVTTIDATCEKDGAKLTKCANCDAQKIETITKTGHSYTDNVVAPTCTSIGYTEHTCSKCGSYYKDNAVNMIDHAYVLNAEKSLAPTCIGKGMNVYDCSVCGHEKVETVNATGHNPGDWQTVLEPTCTGKGYQVKICGTCGLVAETQELSANGHNFNSTVVPETCTTKGYTLNVCTVCGETTYTSEVAALGHAWADTITVDKAATCTSEGQQSIHCTRSGCGAVKDVQAIAKTAHEYELKTVDPTCTTSGYTAYVCKNCDALDKTRDIKMIDPKGHKWVNDSTKTKDATCTEAGTKTYTCSNVNNGVACTETKTEITDMPLGHNWDSWIITKPATATEKGEKTRHCKNNYTEHTETCDIPSIGHKWDAGKVTKAATCTAEGEMTYTCTGCENCNAAGTKATEVVKIPKVEHAYKTITVAPTCTTDGSTVVKCSVCGHEAQSPVTIPATGHAYDAGVITTAATCTTDGVMTYTCQNDKSHTVTENIPAIGHNYDTNGDGKVTAADATETKTATCTEKGKLTYTCQNNASHTYTEDIPMTAHNFAADTAASKTATCTEMGYTVMKCTDCDATYVDKATITPATGHTWGGGTEIQAPTTDSYGIMKYVCSKCGSERLETIAPIGDHEFTLQSEVKPGCETNGEKVWVCTAHTDCPANYIETVPALEHNDGLYSSTDVSCLVDGTETYKCANCGRTYTLLTAYATGHDYKSEITTLATCEADGVRTYTCQNDNTHVKTEVIPKLGHKYVGVVTAPTCKDYGYTTYTCQNDNSHVYISDYKPTTAHTYAKDDAQSVAATCVSKGYDVMVCTNVIDSQGHTCGDSYKVITDATSHDWNDGVITTPATCTANGVKTFTCGNCGDTYTEVIPATGHDYGDGVVVREADGGNTGLIEYTCKRTDCGDKFYEEYVVDSTVHTWNVNVTQNATCIEKGVAVYTCINPSCEVCSHGVTAKFTKQTPALGHDWDDGAISIPATCTTAGEKTYTCKRDGCGATKTEVIPATGHNPQKVKDVPATCISAGYTEYVCDHVDADGNKCGYTMYDNYIAPLTHDLKVEVIAPTCIAAGYTLATCQRADCGYTNITNVTEATGHDYDSVITTEPTCTTDGVKTYTCKNCAADVDGHSYTETVAKTGHAWGEWIITKDPTATEEGIKTRTCAYDTAHTETVTLPKLGHTMVADVITKQPTCTETGTQKYVCTEHTGDAACGYTYEVTLPALGHDWNDGEITTAATCTADGEKTYTCKRDGCGATRTEVVPKTGHDMETAVTEATCVSDKFTTYTCKTCGYSYVINETGTALGHTFSQVVETVDATCEGKGYTIYKCERCDQTKTETTEAIGHDWGEWKTTTPATCEECGVMTRVCKNDPTHIQTRRTATVDHDYVSTVVYPNCTESGFTILACKGCGKAIRTNFVPAYGHKYDEGVYEDATCTEPGGIRYTCTNVDSEGTPCGHSYLVKDTEPLGHSWGAWHYVTHPTVEGAYAKQRDCTRGTCTVIEYERGKMSNKDDINVYYKVEFYNPWTADTYYELNNGRTKLAKTYTTTLVNEGYYIAGTEATYPSSVLPTRKKDYKWGAYKLTKWTEDEAGLTNAADKMKSISENLKVYANFEGYDVYYKVRFWNGSDPLTIEQVILHGHSAQYPFDPPKKADNLNYKYQFTGWDYDYTAIYDSVAISAMYDEIAKTYTMVYCDWNGKELAREDFQYGEPAKNNPTSPSRPADATYIYEFSGLWQTEPGKEQFIDLKSLTVPLGTKEGDEVKVYAKYYSKPREYSVTVFGHGINKENIPGATVQILNSNGYLVSTAQLDENSKATFLLNYDTSYTAVVIDDSGNVGEVPFVLPTDPKDPKYIDVNLSQYEDPEHGGSDCHCICHSFLGRFWISMLNLIYRLFGRKIVCCYDMYATHGDQLVYGK